MGWDAQLFNQIFHPVQNKFGTAGNRSVIQKDPAVRMHIHALAIGEIRARRNTGKRVGIGDHDEFVKVVFNPEHDFKHPRCDMIEITDDLADNIRIQ